MKICLKKKQNKTIKKKEKRKSPPGKQNNRALPRRNLEPIGADGGNLWPFSFGGSVGTLRLGARPW